MHSISSPESRGPSVETVTAGIGGADRKELSNTFQSLDDLRAELRRRGAYKPETWRTMVGFGVLNVMMLTGVTLALNATSPWLACAGIVLSAMAGLGFGTHGHTASHGAFSGSARVDRFVERYSFPFMLGVSINFWRYKHIHTHHRAPNIVGADLDIDIAWPFSVLETKVSAAKGFQRQFYQYQWLALPFVLSLNGFAVQLNGWRHIVRLYRSNVRQPRELHKDVLILVAHYLVWLFIPIAVFGLAIGLTAYLARIALMGYALFIAFAPAHFPEPAMCFDARSAIEDYVLRQTLTTVNFRTGALGRFLCAGVQYQIEHHLFPTICHTHYPRISVPIRAFCEQHGYPHRTYRWSHALWMSALAFRTAKKVLSVSGPPDPAQPITSSHRSAESPAHDVGYPDAVPESR
jgi:fatty acid desaturase